jgi:hypothetical protein
MRRKRRFLIQPFRMPNVRATKTPRRGKNMVHIGRESHIVLLCLDRYDTGRQDNACGLFEHSHMALLSSPGISHEGQHRLACGLKTFIYLRARDCYEHGGLSCCHWTAHRQVEHCERRPCSRSQRIGHRLKQLQRDRIHMADMLDNSGRAEAWRGNRRYGAGKG